MADKAITYGEDAFKNVVAIGIDTGLFWGSNELAAAAGVRRVRTNISDNVVFALSDLLTRGGAFGIEMSIPNLRGMGLGRIVSEKGLREYLKFKQPQFLIVLLGLIIKDGVMKNKLQVVTPLMKTAIGFFGNIAGDMILSPDLM
jgi:hypothetical protein